MPDAQDVSDLMQRDQIGACAAARWSGQEVPGFRKVKADEAFNKRVGVVPRIVGNAQRAACTVEVFIADTDIHRCAVAGFDEIDIGDEFPCIESRPDDILEGLVGNEGIETDIVGQEIGGGDRPGDRAANLMDKRIDLPPHAVEIVRACSMLILRQAAIKSFAMVKQIAAILTHPSAAPGKIDSRIPPLHRKN